MIVDVDDLFEGHDRMDLLLELKAANPAFRVTAFAVPAFCSDTYLESLPEWIEVVPHGHTHGGRDCSDPREAQNWSREQTVDLLLSLHDRYARGWKSPGWQVSDGTYLALMDLGYWCADHPENDHRRPGGLLTHVCGDGDHSHHHVQNVCGNGLEETFDTLIECVRAAESFELISESVAPWRTRVAA